MILFGCKKDGWCFYNSLFPPIAIIRTIFSKVPAAPYQQKPTGNSWCLLFPPPTGGRVKFRGSVRVLSFPRSLCGRGLWKQWEAQNHCEKSNQMIFNSSGILFWGSMLVFFRGLPFKVLLATIVSREGNQWYVQTSWDALLLSSRRLLNLWPF